MSDCWWNGRQVPAGRTNRQKKREVANRDTGVGNGTQPSVILVVLDN